MSNPMDKWSLFFGWVGIASLLLAAPFAIFANLMTPRVVVFWSNSTRARTLRRIAKLETIIANASSKAHDERITSYLRRLSAGLVWAVLGVMYAILAPFIGLSEPNVFGIVRHLLLSIFIISVMLLSYSMFQFFTIANKALEDERVISGSPLLSKTFIVE